MTESCPTCATTCQLSDNLASYVGGDATIYLPYQCIVCNNVFWVQAQAQDLVGHQEQLVIPHAAGLMRLSEQVPPLPCQTVVRLINADHKLAGQRGTIVGHKHLHYRVKFADFTLWVPWSWLMEEDDNGEHGS